MVDSKMLCLRVVFSPKAALDVTLYTSYLGDFHDEDLGFSELEYYLEH